MAGYLGAIPVPQATQHRESFTATSGQTTFNTAGYTVGFLDVYLNGSHLSPADFTATNGSDVVLASGASADDVCDIISYTAFEIADQTFTGTTTLDGAVVINESSADVDFRVESNGNANMLSVDGGTNQVAIGTSDLNNDSAASLLTIGGASHAMHLGSASADGTNGGGFFTSAQKDDKSTGWTTLGFWDHGDKRQIYYGGGNWGPEEATVHVFYTGGYDAGSGGAAERMRIDSSGNVGIGTSSPNADLELGGTGEVLRLSGSTTNAYIRNTDGTTNQWYIGSGGAAGLQHYIYQAQPMTFHTTGAERMRLDSSGRLLIRKTSAATSGSCIEMERDMSSGVAMEINNTASSGTQNAIHFRSEGGVVGKITISTSATGYVTSSDYRLKTDVQPMTGASDRVLALKPVNFEWIVDGTRVDGFLAHEAATVVPEAVTGTKDAMMDEEYEVTPAVLDDDGNETAPAVMGTRSVPDLQGIDQSKMVPLLVAALQDALARITALENA